MELEDVLPDELVVGGMGGAPSSSSGPMIVDGVPVILFQAPTGHVEVAPPPVFSVPEPSPPPPADPTHQRSALSFLHGVPINVIPQKRYRGITYSERWAVRCPVHEECRISRATNIDVEFGPDGVSYFIGAWCHFAGMGEERHRRYRPTSADIRSFILEARIEAPPL